MTESIERAARAVWERDLPEGQPPWDEVNDATREMYLYEAEIVIETLLDPSEEALEAAVAAIEAMPNLYMRLDETREDGLRYEICWPSAEPEVIAAYRDYDVALTRMAQLQRRAFARAAIRAYHLSILGREE